MPPAKETTKNINAYTPGISAGERRELQEEELSAAGWELVRTDDKGISYWHSPNSRSLGVKSTKEDEKFIRNLPTKDNGITPLKQLVQPSMQWEFPVDEAYSIMVSNRKAAEKKPA